MPQLPNRSLSQIQDLADQSDAPRSGRVASSATKCVRRNVSGARSDTQFPSWRPTGDERRRALSAAVQMASTIVGPLGPLFVWALEYVYDRWDLIFNRFGAPTQAYTADGSSLRLADTMPGSPSMVVAGQK